MPLDPLPEIPGLTLIKVLGDGAFGAVYLAEQLEPVRRRVAVKVLHGNVFGRDLELRFQAEQESLASLQHPHVASFFEAGLTPGGQPYFTMEWVDGVGISEYARTHRPELKQRLELMVRVCRGVEHAHQKGVLHRDLKPANVLVTQLEGTAWPKIIDFGIAKVLHPSEAGGLARTTAGELLGTPLYMAPEQLRGGQVAADTRTDVYALGLLLYELLAGVLPFDPAALEQQGLPAAIRELSDGRHASPTQRMRGSPEALHSQASALGTTDRGLLRLLGGDLDTIVMTAIASDPVDRYPSAGALADDLQRYLRAEPIAAAPPTFWYVLRKLMARHRGVAVTAIGGVALLMAAVVWLAVIYGQATRNLARAEAAEANARDQAEQAVAVGSFLTKLFEWTDPRNLQGARTVLADTTRVDDLLQMAESWLVSGRLADSPQRARLLATLGEVQRNRGDKSAARRLLTEALRLETERGGEGSARAIDCALQLATTLTGEHAADRVDSLVSAALNRLEGAGREFDQQIGFAHQIRGTLRARQGHLTEAARDLRTALVHLSRVYTEGLSPRTLALADLGFVYNGLDSSAAAIPLLEEALSTLSRNVGMQHPAAITALSNLAVAYMQTERYAAARRPLEQALESTVAIFGETWRTAPRLNDLASCLSFLGEPDSALVMYREALQRASRDREVPLPYAITSLSGIGDIHKERHQRQLALAAYTRAIELSERLRGPDHPVTGTILAQRGASWADSARATLTSATLQPRPSPIETRQAMERALADWDRAVRIWSLPDNGAPEDLREALEECARLAAELGLEADALSYRRRLAAVRQGDDNAP